MEATEREIWLRTGQVATVLGVVEKTVLAYVDSGQLAAFDSRTKTRRRLRFNVAEVARFKASRTVGAPPTAPKTSAAAMNPAPVAATAAISNPARTQTPFTPQPRP